MVKTKIFFLGAIRGFFGSIWVSPKYWLYWDSKIKKVREETSA